MSTLQTIAARVTVPGETIKGARFVACAVPFDMNDPAAPRAIVESMRETRKDAVHHGFAWRSGPIAADFGWSDDGEPVGAAGAPILRRIDAAGLLNVIVVVSRDGGAQRLSVGDLTRGYGEAARLVLAAVRVVAFVPMIPVTLRFGYGHSGPVQGVLAAFGAEHVAAEYGEDARLVVRVEAARIEALDAALRDATAGAVRVANAENGTTR